MGYRVLHTKSLIVAVLSAICFTMSTNLLAETGKVRFSIPGMMIYTGPQSKPPTLKHTWHVKGTITGAGLPVHRWC